MEIPSTPQEIARNVFQSTVALEMELANGDRVPLGSGFFVAQGLVATNLHVVHGVLKCYAKLVNQINEFFVEGYTHIDVERDLVILKVSGANTTQLLWGNSDNVQVGDTIYAVGNPRGLQGTFSDGIISSIRSDANGKILQMTAPISPGSSGGPVLNEKGNVIGVSFMSFRDGQNLNFAIPSSHLSALLAKPANLQPLYFTKFEGIKLGQLLNWETEKTATYTFSLQNNHRWDVENIDCLVIFYDQQGQHIGFDIVKYSDRIPAGSIRKIIRPSIFDTPHAQNFDYNGWKFDQKISHLIPFIIRSGGDPSNYNIIDPTIDHSQGFSTITIIDYKVLTEL